MLYDSLRLTPDRSLDRYSTTDLGKKTEKRKSQIVTSVFFDAFLWKIGQKSEFICYFCSDIDTNLPVLCLFCRKVSEYERFESHHQRWRYWRTHISSHRHCQRNKSIAPRSRNPLCGCRRSYGNATRSSGRLSHCWTSCGRFRPQTTLAQFWRSSQTLAFATQSETSDSRV